MHDVKLGQLAEGQQCRDAIHVAVAPVTSKEKLFPGQEIALVEGSTTEVSKTGTPVGIVDPFLHHPVQPEQTFWMLLFPQTITSLRHEWTHPAFASAEVPTQGLPDKAASEAWLRKFCSTQDCPQYETVMQALEGKFENYDPHYYERGGYINGEYFHFNGIDAHAEIPDEFWTHAEIVLGKPLRDKPKYFSCSC